MTIKYFSLITVSISRQLLIIASILVFHLAPAKNSENTESFPDKRITNLLLRGRQAQIASNINLSLSYYMQAADLAANLHDSISLYTAYQRIAQLHGSYLRFDKSIEYKTKALKLSERMGNDHYIANARMNIGIEYYSQKNYPEAIKQFQTSLKYCDKENTNLLKGTITYLIALSYLRSSVTGQAKIYFDSAYKLIKSTGDDTRLLDCIVGMSDLQLALGNPDSSISLLQHVMHIADSIAPGTGTSQKGYLIAKAYIAKGDLDKAAYYANSSLNFYSLPEHSKYELADVISVVASVYEAKRDFETSLRFWKQYKLITDSVTSASNQYEINTLLTGIQIDEQNQKIEILNRDNEIQSLWRNALLAGAALLIVIIALVYRNTTIQRAAKEKSDHLLLNILPAEVVDELKLHGFAKTRQFEQVTVMLTDFKQFTNIAEQLSASDLVAELNTCFTAFDKILVKHGVEKIKTVGDAYLAASGLNELPDHALNMAKAAVEIRDYILERKKLLGDKTFEVRIGINTGSVIAGIVGMNKFAYDIWGDTVNVSARMEQSCEPGKINISESTFELIGPFASCELRGLVEAKNKGKIKMYYLNELYI